VRPAKEPVDPWQPLGWLWERERTLAGEPRPTLVVFLAGAECRFRCVFCDLWRKTLDGPTPPGAIPAQLAQALEQAGPVPPGAAIKLYNASNFFDPRAVPEQDYPALLDLLRPFGRVTVECHPRLIGGRAFHFAEGLSGTLEVAMGLETVHPEALSRLEKGMRLEDFEHAAARLRAAGLAVRAFVLLSPPYVPASSAVDWTVRSARYAAAHGAQQVAIIPVRAGNGALEVLAARGDFVPPTLGQLEEALDQCLSIPGAVITADLWDAGRLVACRHCGPSRIARLGRLNLTGAPEPRVGCSACGGR
jgi:hypothetical protein